MNQWNGHTLVILDEGDDLLLSQTYRDALQHLAPKLKQLNTSVQTMILTATCSDATGRHLQTMFTRPPTPMQPLVRLGIQGFQSRPDVDVFVRRLAVRSQEKIVDAKCRMAFELLFHNEEVKGSRRRDAFKRSSIVFCMRKKEVSSMSLYFKQQGVSIATLTSDTSESDRVAAINGINRGTIDTLIATTSAARVDFIEVGCVVMTSWAKTAANQIQKHGRVNRGSEYLMRRGSVYIIVHAGDAYTHFQYHLDKDGGKGIPQDLYNAECRVMMSLYDATSPCPAVVIANEFGQVSPACNDTRSCLVCEQDATAEVMKTLTGPFQLILATAHELSTLRCEEIQSCRDLAQWLCGSNKMRNSLKMVQKEGATPSSWGQGRNIFVIAEWSTLIQMTVQMQLIQFSPFSLTEHGIRHIGEEATFLPSFLPQARLLAGRITRRTPTSLPVQIQSPKYLTFPDITDAVVLTIQRSIACIQVLPNIYGNDHQLTNMERDQIYEIDILSQFTLQRDVTDGNLLHLFEETYTKNCAPRMIKDIQQSLSNEQCKSFFSTGEWTMTIARCAGARQCPIQDCPNTDANKSKNPTCKDHDNVSYHKRPCTALMCLLQSGNIVRIIPIGDHLHGTIPPWRIPPGVEKRIKEIAQSTFQPPAKLTQLHINPLGRTLELSQITSALLNHDRIQDLFKRARNEKWGENLDMEQTIKFLIQEGRGPNGKDPYLRAYSHDMSADDGVKIVLLMSPWMASKVQHSTGHASCDVTFKQITNAQEKWFGFHFVSQVFPYSTTKWSIAYS